MNLTDTHIHLYADDFAHDLPALVAEAEMRGVTCFFLPAIDSEFSAAMDQIAKVYPDRVHLMAGLHPTHVKENVATELQHVKERLDTIDAVAVGEIGIDLYWMTASKRLKLMPLRSRWSGRVSATCRLLFIAVMLLMKYSSLLSELRTKVTPLLVFYTASRVISNRLSMQYPSGFTSGLVVSLPLKMVKLTPFYHK